MGKTVLETNFSNLNLIRRGKVRDIYDLGDKLLIVATDRLSAFDVVLPDPIPDKGKILTQISLFWFDLIKSIVPNHLLSSDVNEFPDVCKPYTDILKDRSMLVKKADPLPIECVVRGYISGSGWKDYRESGRICSIELPGNLLESDKLPEPIFTPSTKAEIGHHDLNIDFKETIEKIGKTLADRVKTLSLTIYKKGAEYAAVKGIIIADTKFEFGFEGDRLILIDEVLTPDSSRFWPTDSYSAGGPQKSFDKQFLRDYLNSLDWAKEPPPPPLPQDIIEKTREKYLEALERLTGHGLKE